MNSMLKINHIVVKLNPINNFKSQV